MPVKVPPVWYLEVNTAGSLAYSIEGSVQFSILMLSESKNCDSLKVQLPQEKVKDADGPAQCMTSLRLGTHMLAGCRVGSTSQLGEMSLMGS